MGDRVNIKREIVLVIVSAVLLSMVATADFNIFSVLGCGTVLNQNNSIDISTANNSSIDNYQVTYSSNTFLPRIWLMSSDTTGNDTYVGQLIFEPDGSKLPDDSKINGQVNLYYHQEDFQNIIDILQSNPSVYLIYDGSGDAYENGIYTDTRAVGMDSYGELPTAGGGYSNITESHNGKTLNLKNGETFYLKLYENPSTGYSWQLNLSKGLSILSDNYTQDPEPPGYVGGGGTHLWVIKAVTQGSQQVNGIYKRSWENTTGTEENFTLYVKII
jgi:predicted secreted protein